MLGFNKKTLIPLCPQCSKELKEIVSISTNTKYYEFDNQNLLYNSTERTKVEDDNVFHCSECDADISVRDILETLACLNKLSREL